MALIEGRKARDWAKEIFSTHGKNVGRAICVVLLTYVFLVLAELLLTSGTSTARTGRIIAIGCENSKAFRIEPPYPDHDPIWIASYPSLMNHFLAPVIDSLVGHEGSVVNLYQSKGVGPKNAALGRCHEDSKVVACMTPFPLLDVEGHPMALREEFSHSYIIALQNPYKAIYVLAATEHVRNNHRPLYSSDSQQLALALPRDKWVRYRDKHFLDAIEDWTRLIDTWKQLKPHYRKSYYAVYEHWMDFKQGPDEANKLAYVLQQAGNAVNSVMKNGCLWAAARNDWQEPWLEMTYTAHQRDVMVQHLREFSQQHHEDTMLVSILEQYIEEMKRDMVIDP